MRTTRIILAVGLLATALPGLAQNTFDRPLPQPVPYQVDTDWLTNASGQSQVIHEEVVHLDGAAWMRLYFGDVSLGQGSLLRITSLEDGEVQELDAAGLAQWNNSTAYFNGDTVTVELFASPGSVNRLILDEVAWEAVPAVPTGHCGYCGPDDRTPSDVTFAGRLLPAGCSANIYNTDSCATSAGHCIGGSMVLQFHVPASNPNCSINHPPVSEQFSVSQWQFSNNGVGNDWSALRIGTNNLGEKPFDRYGEFRPIATTPVQVGDPLTVWSYGIEDENCVDSQAQQTSSGQVDSVQSTSFRHTVDVTNGSSGGGILRNGNEIVGVVTHCPCPTHATRVDHPSFAAARESLCPTSTQDANIISAVVDIWGNHVSGGIPELEASDDVYFVVDSEPGSAIRNTALTVVQAQSPANPVSSLDLRLEFGAANANPVFIIVQAFNFNTSAYDLLHLGIASTSSDTVLNFDNVSGPNAYVNGSGVVQLRLVQTARTEQTPSGFTKRIDHVEVSVTP